MKADWEQHTCGPKVNLIDFLAEDQEMVDEIENAGGEVSDSEFRAHILKVIPAAYKDYINTMLEMANRTRTEISTDDIINMLERHYRYKNPETRTPRGTKSDAKDVALSAEPHTHTHTHPPGSSGSSSHGSSRGRGRGGRGGGGGSSSPHKGPRCYNCGEYGHISRECKAPRKPRTLKVEGEKKKEENSAHVEDENNNSEDSVEFIYFVGNGSDASSDSEPEELFDTVNVEDSMSEYNPLDGLFDDTDDERPPLEPQDLSDDEEDDSRELGF
ncbi:hypothetical protein BT96DRAFT_1009076 [Gymnopus androsaceus JB14]|uniref:CCHC-type domain-containing protein n=1 Tax=Gymnopus androsaceus JB14 TaxID=1447944 RepID=A0A6A4GDJ5_9AGAR|nr:hypothetical protein BT96DRAFT_1009076 [Gymnopus androsaceus JB14]